MFSWLRKANAITFSFIFKDSGEKPLSACELFTVERILRVFISNALGMFWYRREIASHFKVETGILNRKQTSLKTNGKLIRSKHHVEIECKFHIKTVEERQPYEHELKLGRFSFWCEKKNTQRALLVYQESNANVNFELQIVLHNSIF